MFRTVSIGNSRVVVTRFVPFFLLAIGNLWGSHIGSGYLRQ